MKLSFDKKIVLGYVVNVLIVLAIGIVYFLKINGHLSPAFEKVIDWLQFGLIFLVFVLLTFVFYLIRIQIKAKNLSQQIVYENEQLLQSIIDNTSNPISIKKINGEYLMVNRQFETKFQVKEDNIKGKTDQEFLPKEVADMYRGADLDVVKAGKEIKVEENIHESDGIHTYLSVKFPIFDPSGRIHAIGSISTDISERKVFENSLKEGEKFFNLSLDVLAIASVDSFVKLNPTLSKLLGYSEKELLSTPFFKFIHPDDLDKTEKEIIKLQSGANTINFENRWICKDGTIKWLSWIASPDMSTGLLYAVAHDITEIKQNVEALKAGDQFFNLSTDILAIASDTNFLKINPALVKVLGYPEKDLLARSFFSFIHPEDLPAAEAEIENLKKGIPTHNFENRWVCKDGSIKWLNWTASPEIKDGLKMYAVGRDVTEQKSKEETFVMANKFFDMSYDMLVVAKGEYFIKVNSAFTRILGYDQKDMDDRPFLSFAHPDEVGKARQVVENLQKGNAVANFKARGRTKAGEYKILDWTASSDVQSGLMYAVVRDVTDQMKNEEILKIANNFFDLSFDAFIVTKGEKVIKVNPAFTKSVGFTLDDFDKITLLNLIHPDYKAQASERLAKRLKGEDVPQTVVYPIICKDGTTKWFESAATTDVASGMVYIVSRDINEKMKNDEILKIADTFFNMTFDIFAVAKGEKFIRINSAFTEILGYTQEDLTNLTFTNITEDTDLQKEVLSKLLKGEKIVNYIDKVRCKDGTYKWLKWSIKPDIQTGLLYSVAHDVTEQLKLEEEEQKVTNELYENEEKLKLIIDNIGDGVLVANPERKILMANFMATELFDLDVDHDAAFNLSDRFQLYYPDERTIFPSQDLPIEKALIGETTDDVDVVLWNPTSQIKRRVLISGRPLVDAQNHVVAAVVTIKDISRYKQMEEELKETESKYRRVIGFKKGNEE